MSFHMSKIGTFFFVFEKFFSVVTTSCLLRGLLLFNSLFSPSLCVRSLKTKSSPMFGEKNYLVAHKRNFSLFNLMPNKVVNLDLSSS